jgi:hypothetical protein
MPEFQANSAGIDKNLAEHSHSGTSFDPERRAEQEITQFTANVQAVYERLSKHASTEAQKAFLVQEMARFQAGYVAKYNDYLAAKGRCFSVMITGASGFNNRAHDKANSAEDRKYEALKEFRERAEAAILRELKKIGVQEAGGELEVLRRNIQKAEEMQGKMKLCNAILRRKTVSDDDKVKVIMEAIGWSIETARKVLEPDFAGRQGFSFQLTNNNSNIKRMKARLTELLNKEATPTTSQEFLGGRVVDDQETDRVCIYHDSKPSSETIHMLKSSGFRWSPRECAWMRKRTSNALQAARQIVGIV